MVDLPEDLYPAGKKFQELADAALDAYPRNAGDTPIAFALALGLLELEKSHNDTKCAVLVAAHFIIGLRAYVLDLESRILEAGVSLSDSDCELAPVMELAEACDDMGVERQ